jgi:hypothetical protein
MPLDQFIKLFNQFDAFYNAWATQTADPDLWDGERIPAKIRASVLSNQLRYSTDMSVTAAMSCQGGGGVRIPRTHPPPGRQGKAGRAFRQAGTVHPPAFDEDATTVLRNAPLALMDQGGERGHRHATDLERVLIQTRGEVSVEEAGGGDAEVSGNFAAGGFEQLGQFA